VVSEREVPKGGNIIRDEVILLTSQQEIGPQAQLRRIEVWVEERQETLVLVTNNFRLAASTIAAIYKERWQIELFFKALKQSLKIKTFVGTSENAVQIQIWTALIAMLLLKYLKMRSTYAWSFSHLVALLRHQLLVYRDLMTWLNNPGSGRHPRPAIAAGICPLRRLNWIAEFRLEAYLHSRGHEYRENLDSTPQHRLVVSPPACFHRRRL
jgi:hypothetical protein